jgi:hypothetical protein
MGLPATGKSTLEVFNPIRDDFPAARMTTMISFENGFTAQSFHDFNVYFTSVFPKKLWFCGFFVSGFMA